MLPMAGYPFLGDDSRGKPEPEPHRQGCDIVQLYAAVRLRPVKKKGDAHIGQMTGDDDEENRFPPVRRPASKIRHFKTTP
jgi:hypothetical protein